MHGGSHRLRFQAGQHGADRDMLLQAFEKAGFRLLAYGHRVADLREDLRLLPAVQRLVQRLQGDLELFEISAGAAHQGSGGQIERLLLVDQGTEGRRGAGRLRNSDSTAVRYFSHIASSRR